MGFKMSDCICQDSTTYCPVHNKKERKWDIWKPNNKNKNWHSDEQTYAIETGTGYYNGETHVKIDEAISLSAYEFMKSVADGCSQREAEVHDKLNAAIREHNAYKQVKQEETARFMRERDLAEEERDEARAELNELSRQICEFRPTCESEKARSQALEAELAGFKENQAKLREYGKAALEAEKARSQVLESELTEAQNKLSAWMQTSKASYVSLLKERDAFELERDNEISRSEKFKAQRDEARAIIDGCAVSLELAKARSQALEAELKDAMKRE